MIGTTTAWGDSPTIVRVEEDWELVVTNSDPNSNAPQVTCGISPLGTNSSIRAAFEINQQTLPRYVPGGLQVQLWHGEWPLYHHTSSNPAVMAQANDTVTWTQSMRLVDGLLVFEVTNGSSTTWGTFGGEGSLRLFSLTGLEDLNAYSPDVSVANSAIGFAANRVQSLVLKKVRWTTSTGEVFEDTNPRAVHEQE